MVTFKELGEILVAGNDYVFTITVTKDGATFNISGATLTASIRSSSTNAKVIEDHAMTITDDANGIATLTLTDIESVLLTVPTLPSRVVVHYVDVKVVESGGNIVNCGPFSFPVREAIT